MFVFAEFNGYADYKYYINNWPYSIGENVYTIHIYLTEKYFRRS